ncbi:Proline iminopeptidase [Cytospora mali]|uniref:Proline iminopeptidase n=1 Tax=Cytospora mali TaxID=578113 RepID=A0A194V7H4_CYTMA|nr:Proline iminopeptidase [Valsa mali var. pyri (nom. inval.)]
MVDFVAINGARLAYRICGDHRSDHAIYSKLSDQLRVLSFDFRGHGQSSLTKPYTFEQIVDDIEGMRKHFAGDKKVVICGGSFGGFLAQHYAIKYASHVSHLILRGTAASHHHEEGAIETLKKRLAKAPSFSEDMLRNKVFGAYESDLEFQLVHFASMPLYKEVFDPDAALKSCVNNVYVAESHNDLYSKTEKYFDYTSQLNQITAKTLVIVGDQDWICPPENSKLIATSVPGAELFVVEGANHSVHAEKPELVLSKIRTHLMD